MSAGLRRYLYWTAGTTGAAIMIVEILGAKMLAPYVGTSHFVWTAQIAVTLMALATGYYAGGRMVDRSPKLGKMYGCVLVAAIYLCGSVLAVKSVAYWCLDFNLALGSLLAAALLFFIPLSLLAMVYTIGHVSGCHINPAVTLGLLISKKVEGRYALGYWVAQIVGAIVAAVCG